MSLFALECESRSCDDTNLHLVNSFWKVKAIGHTAASDIGRIRLNRDTTSCASHIRNESPLCILWVLDTEVMFSIHGNKSSRWLEDITTHLVLSIFDAHHLWTSILWETVVPFCIANVLLYHHTIPLATSNFLVVATAENRIALEALFYSISPYVCLWIALGIELMVHCLSIVHVIDIGKSLDWEEQKLTIGIACILRKRKILTQSICLKAHKLVAHLLELACLDVVGRSIEHLGSDATSILAVEIQDACSLIGL